ncbi:MAG: HEAT repeat domain-containing protein, partial [Planctomycetota bacterium]|nr:HEAT repeat domain-containing protein [Planctomycetota bacterium]
MLFLGLLLLLDVETQIASRDVQERLAAIATIVKDGHPSAEQLLLDALKDGDWEVVEHAAVALGTRGGEHSVDPLVLLALKGPVRRMRHAAAAAAGKLAPALAAEKFQKRARGQTAMAAADALVIVPHPAASKALEALLRNKDGALRALALRALGGLKQPERIKDITKRLKDSDLRVRAAGVDALEQTGSYRAIAPLIEGMKDPAMTAVMERRHIAAITAVMQGIKDPRELKKGAETCLYTFGSGGQDRFARLYARLGRHKLGPVDEYIKVLERGCAHAEIDVRRASVWALGFLGDDRGYAKVSSVAKGDSSEQVRFHALRAAVQLRGAKAAGLIIDRIRYDEHPVVREEACVLAGRQRLRDALIDLAARLKDDSWEVCLAAAVSLGKLRAEEGVAPLVGLLKNKDWRRRGAGVTGLGWSKQKKAVPSLIASLRDKELAVAATAAEFLRHISGKDLDPRPKTWKDWWKAHGPNFMFRDPKEEAKNAKKYGYAVTPREVYEDLDIVVLQTRRGGDNIQFLLEDYEITYREVRAASVQKAGLHPHALFVANCPGEINRKDGERLQWFVRSGGYMFASCWALTKTIHECFPGIVRHMKTRAQVLDVVEAEPVRSTSPLLKGVFDKVTRPHYMLEGSHLIEVLDPERFEVLIDSPECASRWGDGNLAGWFTIGHGLILDSANHFDLQGMIRAKLRSETDRMAFAVDHLGY